tara:strand:+ start:1065 stop:2393 length:1329 start_codon:yes stop_codon:yes gene_type:complete
VKNQVIIKKVIKPFKNKIYVSGDKSISIRCLLLSSIALGKSRIFNILESEDVLNTLKSLKKIGVEFKKKKKFIEVYGVGINGFNLTKKKILYAGNSGTLARSILGLCSGINNEIELIGDESLSKRDFSRVIKPLNLFGVNIKSKKGMLPLNLVGSEFLRPIEYIENKGSAQIKTCIILSALNTHGTTKIKAVKSRDHTELMLKSLNYPIQIKSEKKYDLIKINGMKQFKSFDYNVPGDISSASFFIVLTLLSKNSELLIKNINVNPTRIGVINILNIMNSKIKVLNKKNYKGEQIGDIKVKSSNNFKSINCPKILNSSAIDEFLLIFLIACKSKGVSRFKNLGELNKKESPRLDIAIKFMKMIGIKVERKKNDIKIYGNPNLKLDGKYHIKNFVKDHRIFMMSVVAALTFGGKNWIINDKDSVNSSFPNFIKTIKKLGGILN